VTGEISTKFCSTIETGSTHCELRTGVKSAVYDRLVITCDFIILLLLF